MQALLHTEAGPSRRSRLRPEFSRMKAALSTKFSTKHAGLTPGRDAYMARLWFVLSAAILLLGSCARQTLPPPEDEPMVEPVRFLHDVKPILDAQCIDCHQGASAEGMYDLSSLSGLYGKGSDDVRNAIPGNASSRLLQILDEPSHADQGQAQVAGALEVITAQDPQAAGIIAQAFRQAKFSGEIRDVGLVKITVVLAKPGVLGRHVLVVIPAYPVQVCQKRIIFRSSLQFFLRNDSQHPYGITRGFFPYFPV